MSGRCFLFWAIGAILCSLNWCRICIADYSLDPDVEKFLFSLRAFKIMDIQKKKTKNHENKFMKIQWIKFLCFNMHKKVSWKSQHTYVQCLIFWKRSHVRTNESRLYWFVNIENVNLAKLLQRKKRRREFNYARLSSTYEELYSKPRFENKNWTEQNKIIKFHTTSLYFLCVLWIVVVENFMGWMLSKALKRIGRLTQCTYWVQKHTTNKPTWAANSDTDVKFIIFIVDRFLCT